MLNDNLTIEDYGYEYRIYTKTGITYNESKGVPISVFDKELKEWERKKKRK